MLTAINYPCATCPNLSRKQNAITPLTTGSDVKLGPRGPWTARTGPKFGIDPSQAVHGPHGHVRSIGHDRLSAALKWHTMHVGVSAK